MTQARICSSQSPEFYFSSHICQQGSPPFFLPRKFKSWKSCNCRRSLWQQKAGQVIIHCLYFYPPVIHPHVPYTECIFHLITGIDYSYLRAHQYEIKTFLCCSEMTTLCCWGQRTNAKSKQPKNISKKRERALTHCPVNNEVPCSGTTGWPLI